MRLLPSRRSLALRSTALLVIVAAACGGRSKTQAAPTPAPAGGSVSGDELTRNPTVSIEQYLASRVSGVTVAQNENGSLSVRIRGATSFNSNAEPLFVIDGIAMQAGAGGTLTGLNPYDIESIKVLKDAASTTLYGARGANGVILIKTKRSNR